MNKSQDMDTLIVLDGLRGLSYRDAKKFLDGKRNLLDNNSTVGEYLNLATEYDSIGAKKEAKALREKADELGRK